MTPSWSAFLGIALLTAFSPGPALAVAVGRALSSGARAAAISSAGNVFGVLVVGGLCAIVLRDLGANTAAMAGLRLVGGIYLLVLGVRAAIQSRAPGTPSGDGAGQAGSPALAFLGGACVALLNPKSYLLFCALLHADAPGASLPGNLLRVASFAGCTALSHATYILACRRGRLSAHAGRVISRCCGLVTALLGLSLIISR